MRINKHDTNGIKPLLGKGELGYDDYAAGGDVGRVYVGTGTENIPVAKKSEVMAVDGKADAHIARVDNPHGVTKAQVGLGLVDNTADGSKNVLSATKWTAARTITLSGDIAGSASVDGSANVTIVTTVQPNSVALGTDTTGNYVAGVTAGTGISISGTAEEGWSPTITNTAPNVTTNITTTHNATNVVVNSSDGTNGTVNGATQTLAGVMTAADKVKLDGVATGATANTGTVTSIATSGAITGGTIISTGTISHSTADGYLHVPATGTTNNGKVLTAGATAGSLSWTTLPSAPVTSVAGKTGVVSLVKADVGLENVDNTSDANKNVLSATKLATARTIALTGDVTGSVLFDGSANASISATIAANSVALGTDTTGNYVAGVTAGQGITISGTAGEGWSPTIALSALDLTLFPTSNFKKSVKVATTANITLSGVQTIDGISVVAGDRVLVKDQTTASQNGIYIVNASTWTRSVAADGANEIDSAVVGVDQGTINGGRFFTNTFKTTDTVGTTAMPWYEVATTSSTVSSANTLATARTVQTNLGSTASASFNGSANITPGVTGTLPVSNGGTGATTLTGLVKGNGTSTMSAAIAGTDYVVPSGSITGNASTATTLQTARTISGVSFNGSANIDIEDRLGTAIASAATTTIGTRGLGDYIHITGTTTITSFGTAAAAGVRRTLIFDGALTLTHNATSLICPGATNIVTVAGTVIEVVAETTANWRVVSITHPSLSMAELGYLDGVTSAIQTQLNAKAALASPALTGTPTTPTAAVGTSTTQIASTAFVNAEIANDAVLKVTSTDNAIVRFNGITGDVQNSNVVIDDSGNVGIGTSSIFSTGGRTAHIYNSLNDGTPNSNSTLYLESANRSSNVICKGLNAGFQGWDTSGNIVGIFGIECTNKFAFITTNGLERMRIDSAGNVSIGTSDVYGKLGISGQVGTNCGSTQALSARGLQFFIDGTKHGNLSVDNNDNLLYLGNGLGYGTGAGGIVTQLTSKSTVVTLNKPCGEIAMNDGALGAGASVTFTVNNSLVALQDTVVVNYDSWSVGGIGRYAVRAETIPGTIFITLKNETGGTLSEGVRVHFSIIKGAVS